MKKTTITMIQIGTAILAIVAIAVSIVLTHDAITSARRDSCHLLRGIVHLATPPGDEKQAQAFILRTPLRNCNKYAQNP